MAKRGGARKGSGRKKMEGVVYTSIRIDADDWERIPKPKAAYVRQAVKERLRRAEVEAMKTVTKGAKEEKIEEMRNNGVCEYLRLESQGPAIHDKLWEAHLELSRELDELSEYIVQQRLCEIKWAIESIADYGGCLTGEDAQEMKQIAIEALQ